MKKGFRVSLFLVTFLASGWFVCIPSTQAFQGSTGKETSSNISPEAQKERDHILSLLTLAFVHNDWQQKATNPARGHNIGSILVDRNGMPVFWTRNSVKILDNSNQHGEVRLATRYLSSILTNKNIPSEYISSKYMPGGYVLYTSLEPCAMCTGMLSMVGTERVVFTQKDPEFGNVVDALKSIQYPRIYTVATPVDMTQKKQLESGWEIARGKGVQSITDYLLTPEAEKIYASAKTELASYREEYQENALVLKAAVLLAQSTLPELIGPAGQAQKIWQTGIISYSGKSPEQGAWNLSPTLFINYVDWTGQKNVAQVVDDAFYICTPHNPCKKTELIEYMNNKSPWKASISNGVFTHTTKDENHTHQDGKIVYENWQGEDKLGVVRNIALPD